MVAQSVNGPRPSVQFHIPFAKVQSGPVFTGGSVDTHAEASATPATAATQAKRKLIDRGYGAGTSHARRISPWRKRGLPRRACTTKAHHDEGRAKESRWAGMNR